MDSERRPPGSSRHPPQHGDEAALFEEFHLYLTRIVQAKVHTSPDIVDDACAFAWAAFVRHQPDRDGNWRGWLVTTAEREAWRLHGKEAGNRPFWALSDTPGEWGNEPLDPRDAQADRDALREALALLAAVPERRRQAKALLVIGLTYDEIAEALGLSYTRVNRLINEANAVIREEHARTAPEHLPRTPRAARLRSLEASPPPWLVMAIGPPQGGRTGTELKLAWRRAALALDDFRDRYGGRLGEGEPLGPRPYDDEAARAYDVAAAAVQRVRRVRERERDPSRADDEGAEIRRPPSLER